MQTNKGIIWTQTDSKSLVYKIGLIPSPQGFKKGTIENNLYIKSEGNHLLIVVVYVDDIIFGSDME